MKGGTPVKEAEQRTFNVKEFTALVRILLDEGVPKPVVDLVQLVGGQRPRDQEALEAAVKAVAKLGSPPSKRDVDSVKPHPNAIDDPEFRGTVKAKPTELDSARPGPVKRRK
jgi:hypothetical protein